MRYKHALLHMTCRYLQFTPAPNNIILINHQEKAPKTLLIWRKIEERVKDIVKKHSF